MILIPLVMNKLEKKGTFKRMPWLGAPLQIGLLGVILTFATPMCCAIFKQQASISASSVEPELQEKLSSLSNPPALLYYNKGL